MEFRHETIDASPPCGRLGNCLTTDLTGNGRPDVIVSGMGEELPRAFPGAATLLRLPGSGLFIRPIVRRFESNVFWYENPGWERHRLTADRDLHLDVGATLHDVDDDGRVDLLVGQGFGKSDVFWYEQPEDPRDPWTQHLLTDRFQLYHDLAVGDVDGDGEPEVVGLSQEAEALFYYDVPDDPNTSPWPDDHLTIIDDGRRLEGLELVDVDGDGEMEIIAGTSIYRPPTEPDSPWRREDIAEGWDGTRIATADLDGDGELEVVLAEGDSPTYGTHPARLAWFDPPDWEPTFLREDLFCPHSLEVADFDGDGRPDIYVGEMGLGDNDDPKHLIYRNRGGGAFEEILIDTGVPTHQATVVDLNGDGRPDVVGKSYGPDCHVDVWYNES